MIKGAVSKRMKLLLFLLTHFIVYPHSLVYSGLPQIY